MYPLTSPPPTKKTNPPPYLFVEVKLDLPRHPPTLLFVAPTPTLPPVINAQSLTAYW